MNVNVVGLGKGGVIGLRGEARPNSYGIKEVVVVPHLPPGIDRLVPVPEGWKLQDYATGKSGYLRSATG